LQACTHVTPYEDARTSWRALPRRVEECDKTWHVDCSQVEDFKATFGGNVPMGTVTVVKELEEEEDFWEYFVLG
jgi:hypothetical protein